MLYLFESSVYIYITILQYSLQMRRVVKLGSVTIALLLCRLLRAVSTVVVVVRRRTALQVHICEQRVCVVLPPVWVADVILHTCSSSSVWRPASKRRRRRRRRRDVVSAETSRSRDVTISLWCVKAFAACACTRETSST